MMDDSLSTCSRMGMGWKEREGEMVARRGEMPTRPGRHQRPQTPKMVTSWVENCDAFAFAQRVHHERDKNNINNNTRRRFVTWKYQPVCVCVCIKWRRRRRRRRRKEKRLFLIPSLPTAGDEDDLRPQTWLASICPPPLPSSQPTYPACLTLSTLFSSKRAERRQRIFFFLFCSLSLSLSARYFYYSTVYRREQVSALVQPVERAAAAAANQINRERGRYLRTH